MRIGMPHAPYIANKIALDLFNTDAITFNKGIELVKKFAQEVIESDLKKEKALEQRVEEILEENEDEIEFQRIDRRNMFWLIKKRIAEDFDVILSYEDRFNNVAHQILEKLKEEDLITYSVSENIAKNIIYRSIEKYLNTFESIEEETIKKIENYKRKLIPGSEDYNLVYERLYKEELQRRGML